MAEITTTSNIVRQAPYLEDIQRKILEQAMVRGETPVTIPGLTVAPMDELTTQAITRGSGIGQYEPYLTKGAGTVDTGLATLTDRTAGVPGLLTEAAQAARGSDQIPTAANLQPYMDPYAQIVSQNALAEMNRQGQLAANQIRANQVGQGAFGGARGELELAELQRNITDMQGRRYYEDMSRNFQQAQNAFQNQQNRQQTVSQLLGALGQTTGQEAERLSKGIGSFGQAQAGFAGQGQQLLANEAGLLSQLGSTRQRQGQLEIDAARQTALQQAYEPFQRIAFTSDIFKPSIGSAQSTLVNNVAPSPSPLSQAIGAGIGAFGLQAKIGSPFDWFKPSTTQS
tara:strand:+ start:24 stop:1046 length:1023 start_codon:yes stop_codon:yes gene_type:complete